MLLANSKYRHTSADFRYLCRSCFLHPWFNLLIVLLNSSLRDYLICTSREEELRFNLENFWINEELRWKMDVFMKFSKNQTWTTITMMENGCFYEIFQKPDMDYNEPCTKIEFETFAPTIQNRILINFHSRKTHFHLC